MKFQIPNFKFQIVRAPAGRGREIRPSPFAVRRSAAFTMIEIAICLAIISFALVAIIGVLPLGMNTQRDNREQTVINQDATVLVEAVRTAASGADYLTNYVYAIVNTGNNTGYYNPAVARQMNFNAVTAAYPGMSWNPYLISGSGIVGLLSTPEYANGITNHILAYVRSLSGLASEQPPQTNAIMVGDAFSYRVYCVNAPVAQDNPGSLYGRQLNAGLHELRLTFLWPQLPNGNVGNGRQTFRASIAGQLVADPANQSLLYYYRPQSFTPAP